MTMCLFFNFMSTIFVLTIGLGGFVVSMGIAVAIVMIIAAVVDNKNNTPKGGSKI